MDTRIWMLPALLSALMIHAAAATAADQKQISLEHRQAAELLPTLEALAADSVTIVPHGRTLLLKGPRIDLVPLLTIVGELDTPIPELLLQVRSERIECNRSHGESRTRGTRRDGEQTRIQTVRVQAGEAARIVLDQHRPRQGAWLVLGGDVAGVGVRVRQRDLRDGVYVRTDVRGDQAHVELAAETGHLHRGPDSERAGLTTTVRGPMGKWMLIAATLAGDQEEESRTYATRRADQVTWRWWLRVEQLD